ncbi:hypothetical protein AN639_11140 [Candidatus Epulonipiscium fishelsonii]|uniref:Uncharacterized protein n=1 Tax=Candidatus Epulonipiscium fishelsonii TaxID=77094 RepID=A0ACC8X961_9FIRM|nr:hypothetical protein AN396_10410 [Epulopiscium sp. SCG-B11WGA-EpuloA1]ONI43145.1 hypothetical protein AN639_11140 [Epulopiscium sp. SCG-B05WGA-EpuloA1]
MEYNKKIPQDAIIIITILEAKGFEAYIVGGCVRDILMDRTPNDWDITTSATPAQVKQIFKRTYDTGIEHGTVTVIISEEHFEVTTFRTEDKYEDFRRPASVSFVTDINTDLSRRDFAMNAIAYHPERGFIDPYNGKIDIEHKMISSVRNATDRFSEDALRILRAVRFSAQLGFSIDGQTTQGIVECKSLLSFISKERIRDEFTKICLSNNVYHIDKLYELGLLEYIVPEFVPLYTTEQNHPHHIYNVAQHTIEVMKGVPSDVVLRYAALLHDIGKYKTQTVDKEGIHHFKGHALVSEKIAKKVLKDLKWDNNTIKEVCLLVKYHDYHLDQVITSVLIKKLLRELSEPLFDKLVILHEADARAQNPAKLDKKLMLINKIKFLKNEITQNNECYTLKDLAINGLDILNLNIVDDKRKIGTLLEYALDYVLENPTQNQQEILIDYVSTKVH